jgi:hypothetical protein
MVLPWTRLAGVALDRQEGQFGNQNERVHPGA